MRETNPSNPIVVANEATTVSMLCPRRHKHTNDNLRKILCFIRCHRVAKYLTIDHNIHRENCHLKGVPIQTNPDPNKSYCWLCPTAKFPQRISISCCPVFAPCLPRFCWLMPFWGILQPYYHPYSLYLISSGWVQIPVIIPLLSI